MLNKFILYVIELLEAAMSSSSLSTVKRHVSFIFFVHIFRDFQNIYYLYL